MTNTDHTGTAEVNLDSPSALTSTNEAATMSTLIELPAHITDSAEAYAYRLQVATDMVMAEGGELAALLATDVDHSPALHDGYEVQLDTDDSQVALVDFTHASYNVAQTARWSTPQLSSGTGGTLHDATGTSQFIGPRMPALAPRFSSRFNAAKLYASEQRQRTATDRAAFPYLYKANGQRGSVKSTQGYNAARKRLTGK